MCNEPSGVLGEGKTLAPPLKGIPTQHESLLRLIRSLLLEQTEQSPCRHLDERFRPSFGFFVYSRPSSALHREESSLSNGGVNREFRPSFAIERGQPSVCVTSSIRRYWRTMQRWAQSLPDDQAFVMFDQEHYPRSVLKSLFGNRRYRKLFGRYMRTTTRAQRRSIAMRQQELTRHLAS